MLDRPATATQITHLQRLWLYVLVGLVLAFLIVPCLIVIPMSFSASKYLEFPPRAWSLQWYRAFLGSPAWLNAAWLSIRVALMTTLLATVLGTIAAYGLARVRGTFVTLGRGFFMLPMLVPLSTAAALMLAPKRPGPQRWTSLTGSVALLASALLIFVRVNAAGVQVLHVVHRGQARIDDRPEVAVGVRLVETQLEAGERGRERIGVHLGHPPQPVRRGRHRADRVGRYVQVVPARLADRIERLVIPPGRGVGRDVGPLLFRRGQDAVAVVDVQALAQRIQAVALAGIGLARQSQGIQHRAVVADAAVGRPQPRQLGVEEAQVEGRVVDDEFRPFDVSEELVGHVGEARLVGQELDADAVHGLGAGVGYKLELELADNAVDLVDTFVTYKTGPWLLALGNQNQFQSLDELTGDTSGSFMERAAFTDAFNFERRLGLSAQYEKGAWVLQAGLFADDITALSNSSDGPAGGDENNSHGLDGRVVWGLTYQMLATFFARIR